MDAPDTRGPSDGRLAELVARTLRHQVGDLLQSVYSTVALLQEQLPPDSALERRLLADLRARAETCKHELDAAHDLVCPTPPASGPTDLAELVARLAAAFTPRYPNVQLQVETAGPLPVLADGRRLLPAGWLLLRGACQGARRQVVVLTRALAEGTEAEWCVRDDGPGATAEQLEWLDRPFPTTQHAQLGLGLALARQIAEQHGGRFRAGNRPEGGFEAHMVLPLASSAVNG
jgi:signal transduction histidine kinase